MDALTRRWGRARLVLACAAAILLTVGFIVPQLSGLRPWGDRAKKWRIAGFPPGQDTAQWTAFRAASSSDIAVWTAKANDNSKWDPRCDAVGAAILNDPTFSVQGNTLDALSNTDIWWATDIYGIAWGEALTPKKIVIDSTIAVDEAFGTLIHEAQHHAQRAVSDAEIVAINDSLDALTGGTLWLEHCHDEAKEEEEEEDEPNGGETPTEPTTPTCTDQQVWVTWTEWERVEETTGEWEAVPGNPFDVNANDPDNPSDSGVHYVPVVRVYYRPVERGEWQTQQVCSS